MSDEVEPSHLLETEFQGFLTENRLAECILSETCRQWSKAYTGTDIIHHPVGGVIRSSVSLIDDLGIVEHDLGKPEIWPLDRTVVPVLGLLENELHHEEA